VASTGLHCASHQRSRRGRRRLRGRQNARRQRTAFLRLLARDRRRAFFGEKMRRLQIKPTKETIQSGEDVAVSIIAPYGGGSRLIPSSARSLHMPGSQTNTSSGIPAHQAAIVSKAAHQRLVRSRSIQEGNLRSVPLSYRVCAFHRRMTAKTPTLKIDLDSAATVKPGDALHWHLRDGSTIKDRGRGPTRGFYRVTDYKRKTAGVFLPQMRARCRDHADCRSAHTSRNFALRNRSQRSAVAAKGDSIPFKRVTENQVGVHRIGVLDASQMAVILFQRISSTAARRSFAVRGFQSDTTECTPTVTRSFIGPFVVTPKRCRCSPSPVRRIRRPAWAGNGAHAIEGLGCRCRDRITGRNIGAVVSDRRRNCRSLKVARKARSFVSMNDALAQGRKSRFTASRSFKARNDTCDPKCAAGEFRSSPIFRGASLKRGIDVPIKHQIYNEFAKRDAAPATPLGLATRFGLSYHKVFPFRCNRAILLAGAFCRLVWRAKPILGLNRGE